MLYVDLNAIFDLNLPGHTLSKPEVLIDSLHKTPACALYLSRLWLAVVSLP